MNPSRSFLWPMLLLVFTFHAKGQVPSLINFQGRLAREEQAFSGAGEFKFSLVDGNGSTTFWSNDGTGRRGGEPSNAVPVLVHRGLFSVTLGDTALPNMTPVSPLVFTNADVRLRVWFREARGERNRAFDAGDRPEGDMQKPGTGHPGMGAFELLTPDQRITSVGYAMFAANVPDGAITTSKLAPNAVDAAALAPSSVGTRHLADGVVTASKLAPDAFPPVVIGDGSVATRHLAENAVTTSKLADVAVTRAKLATDAVATAQLVNNAVTQDKLALASVGPGQLVAHAVGSNQLASGAALANLIANGQSVVPPGGVILSFDEDSPALTSVGYGRSGSFGLTPERWELRTGPEDFVYYAQIAVWTGTEVIAAYTDDARGFQGARYDPRSNAWHQINSTGAPSLRAFPAFLWTGSEMVVWGGFHPATSAPLQDGFLFNPAADRWRPMTLTGAPSARRAATTVWTGSEMLLWGGLAINGGELNTGGRYDPARDQWRSISTSGSPSARYNHTSIWTGEEMIVWGGQVGFNPRSVFSTGARYQPANDTWTSTPDIGAPAAASEHTAIWTGSEMIVWGGGGADYTPLRSGARFGPTRNSWQPLTLLNAPAGRAAHAAVWTGREMIVWGGTRPGSIQTTGTGGRYDPATEQWFPLTTFPALEYLYDQKAFWLGDGMLIVGGRSGGNVDSSIMPFWRPAVTAYLYQRR